MNNKLIDIDPHNAHRIKNGVAEYGATVTVFIKQTEKVTQVMNDLALALKNKNNETAHYILSPTPELFDGEWLKFQFPVDKSCNHLFDENLESFICESLGESIEVVIGRIFMEIGRQTAPYKDESADVLERAKNYYHTIKNNQ